MDNDQFYIKLSLRYGLLGALAFPFIYESYANIMHSFAIAIALIGCVYAGLRFSRFRLSCALGASAFFVILSGGLGAFFELMMHSHVVSFLEKRSKYFYMSYKDVAVFVAWIFLCYFVMLTVCMIKLGLSAAVKRIKKNSEISGSFIDNAFGDDDE